jgi:5-oxoprolinase (ATP-hydrolysing)
VIEVDERVLADGTVERRWTNLACARARSKAKPSTTASAPSPSPSCTATATRARARVAANRPRDRLHAGLVSHEVSPLMKLVGRGDTTVVDAYLSPILRRYVDQVERTGHRRAAAARLMFMQSSGGLTAADCSRARTRSCPARPAASSAWSRPAMAGFDKIIGFDMGGTSTDVATMTATTNAPSTPKSPACACARR